MTEYFFVAIVLAKERRNYVAINQFYVLIELARVGRIYVAIEDFYVATELAMIESSATHDRAGRAKAGTCDSVVLCCVVTEEAMSGDRPGQARVTYQARRARQALGADDKGACTIGEFYHNREFSITADLDSDEKKRPLGFGAPQLGIRA